MNDEVLYAIRVNKHNSLVLTKFDGHKDCVDQYTITQRGKGRCDCYGSMRNGNCKHKQIAQKLDALNVPSLMGSFYDYDRGLLYTPLDNEGIPLDNLVDITTMAYVSQQVY